LTPRRPHAFDACNAILVYLAAYDPEGRWLPRDAVGAARVQQWLSVAAGQLFYGPMLAVFIKQFGAQLDLDHAQAISRQLFEVLDKELAKRPFLAGDAPTIADVALYTYTALAPEGGVPLDPYGHVRVWLARIEALPGFVPMHHSEPPAAA